MSRFVKGTMLLAVLMVAAMISLTAPVRGQPVFTPSSQSHIQNITWVYGLWQGSPRYPFVGGFAYTGDLEPKYFQAQKTRITVSFPYTPDPSVIGTDNWLAAGMYCQGQGGVDREDYAFYAVLVLDCNGALWYDVGAWVDHEKIFPWDLDPTCTLDFHKTWLIQGVSRSTPITLTMCWDPGPSKTVFWYATIGGQDYYPSGNSFDAGAVHPSIIKAFYVGMFNCLGGVWPWSWWCYYFQFGIMSPLQITQAGWQAQLRNPEYFKDDSWQKVATALSLQGGGAWFDYTYMWGGNTYSGINVATGQTSTMNIATFYYDGSTLDDWLLFWPIEGGGGCPFVSPWNGTQYAVDNNILPASESNCQTDVEDYYKLEKSLVPSYETDLFSVYSLRIQEFEREHDYIDQVKLLAVDHSQGGSVAVTPEGEIVTYSNPAAPISCLDNDGNDRLSEISNVDGNISEPATYFQGHQGDSLVLNFGRVQASNAKLVLRDDQKCADICIEVQVPDLCGNWLTVEVLHPRDYWAMEAVNLAAYVPDSGNLTIRLLWTAPHRLDYVALDTTENADFDVHTAFMLRAKYNDGSAARQKLTENDGIYAELIPGKYIQLEFALPTNSREMRTFIVFAEGHYLTLT